MGIACWWPIRAIYQNDRKCDRKDAEMLARIARSDETLLYPVSHVSEEMQRDLLRIKLRDNLVRQRVDIISSVRGTLKSLGVRLPSPNSGSFAALARKTLEKEHAELLALVTASLRVLDAMTEQIRNLEREVEDNRRSQQRSDNTTVFLEAWECWKIPMPRVVEKPWPQSRQAAQSTI